MIETQNFEFRPTEHLPTAYRRSGSPAIVQSVIATFTHDVMKYEGGHLDLLLYAEENKLPQNYLFLKNLKGDGIRKMNLDDIADLVGYSQSKMPAKELVELRTLLRQAELLGQLVRKQYHLCDVCERFA